MRIQSHSKLAEQAAAKAANAHIGARGVGGPGGKKGPAPVGGGAPPDGVKVTMSAEAQKLASAKDASFDEAKVAQLKASIDDGSFKVDAQKIAQKIVGEDVP